MTLFVYVLFVIGAGVTLSADEQRRRLTFQKRAGWRLLTALDVACLAATAGVAWGLIPHAVCERMLPLYAPETWGIAAAGLLALFLWTEGRRHLQFQRPAGIGFGEWLILGGAYQLIKNAGVGGRARVPRGAAAVTACVVGILAGGA